MRYRKPWNKHKTDFLIVNYPGNSIEFLTEKLELSKSQINSKAHSLGLKKTEEFKSKLYSDLRKIPSVFSDTEIEDLLKETRNYQYVSNITGLSVGVLRDRNFKNWKIQINPWDDSNIKKLIQLFPNYTDKEISKIMNLSVKQIQYKARQLGLKKNISHIDLIQKENAKNIASGPFRHQFSKGSDSAIFYGVKENHPNWISDRSKIKGGRRKSERFSVVTMKKVTEKQKDQCKYCGCSLFGKGEFDHIKPICIGGSSNIDNCQLLCSNCHNFKTKNEQKISNNFRNKERLLILNIQESYEFVARELI